FDALTTEDAPVAAAARAGHRVAVVVGASVVVSALGALATRWVSHRVVVSARGRRRVDLALAALAAVMVIGGLAAAGGPAATFNGFKSRFNADPAAGDVDLNDRLFSVSGNGRSEQLRVAWHAGRERPVLGYGSGTFEYLWYERRPDLLVVRDAH